jgi:hypothetical protein
MRGSSVAGGAGRAAARVVVVEAIGWMGGREGGVTSCKEGEEVMRRAGSWQGNGSARQNGNRRMWVFVVWGRKVQVAPVESPQI